MDFRIPFIRVKLSSMKLNSNQSSFSISTHINLFTIITLLTLYLYMFSAVCMATVALKEMKSRSK